MDITLNDLNNLYSFALNERKEFGTKYGDTDDVIILYIKQIMSLLDDPDYWLNAQLENLESIGITKDVLSENGVEVTGLNL